MDIKLLRAFVVLARQGSYHSAAEQLFITQPALTKQIQTLESLCGLTLFLRGRHGAKLTVAGELLLPGARGAVERYDQFYVSVVDIQKGNAGKLKVGFGISSFRLAPERVAAFRSLFPGLQVTLNDMPSAVQLQQLIEGTLQAGFVRLPVPEPLTSNVLTEETLVLAVASTRYVDSILPHEQIEMNQLLQLSRARGEGLWGQISRYLSVRNLTPRTISAADDIQTLLALVAAGDGVALLPASVSHILPVGVKLLTLDGEFTSWQTGIAWNPQINDPLRDHFIAMVEKQ
ncbi:LysR family transcriptional regulator [Citrobacter amalonaticus]|uniref:LysR family transcriptional regulator n=1 Tax=Citrobacter amalonaticus TaxID=35703 RepID=UPI00207D2C86|nr:LysR family transcriptional regulator [Citrobacter amalonaticus]MCO4157359.1 LysR family transcriptional regulator [Citrobacter amalonaticus]